ncbi:MAG: hypothetical protein AAF666_21205 [Pseudomonadota bacterium]
MTDHARKMRIPLIAASFGAALTLSSHPSAAQNVDDELVGEDIIVTFTEDATGPVGDNANPPTNTGTKTPVLLSEVPR